MIVFPMKKLSITTRDLLLTLIAALAISIGMAVFQRAPFFEAWFGSWLLLWVSLFLLIKTWRFFQSGRWLAVLLLVCFFLRVFLGLFIYTALPQIGNDNEVENAGYVYSDAYHRDTQALVWAKSETPLVSIFSSKNSRDQYGGLQFISASLYRLFSVDEPRPLFTTILAAMTMSAGVPFLYDALKRRWGAGVARVAAWFYTLYPDSVLLGSSQMREPFLIGLFCIAFWMVVTRREKTTRKLLFFFLLMGVSLAISLPLGGLLAGLLIMWGLIEWITEQKTPRSKTTGIILLILAGIAALTAGYMWVKPTVYYDAYLTRTASGLIAALFKLIDEKWHIPLTTFYGLAQPFLPAALVYPSLPFWRVTAIIRGLGWWFMLPFLLYGFFAVWKAKPRSERWLMAFIALALTAWTVVTSLRAGGDLWDNPRYRALLIPWFALLLGWCWQRIRQGHLAWFLRWTGVVLVFFSVILLWYLLRYHIIKGYLGFFDMALIITLASAGILLSGLLWDGYKWLTARKKKQQPDGSG